MTIRLRMLVSNPTEKGDGTDLPYIALEHVESESGALLDAAVVEERDSSGAIPVEPGDVLFGKLRPYLAKVLLVEDRGCASPELLTLRPGPELDSRYLYYLCLSKPFLDWANASAYGVKMPRTSWDLLSQHRPYLPDLAEQRRIANYLDTQCARVDALNAELEYQQILVMERRQGVIDGLLRPGGARDAARSVALPWRVHVQGDWAVLPLRFAVEGVTVGIVINPSSYYADDGVPVLRGLNVRPGVVSSDSLVYMSETSNLLHSKSILRGGDIVVVRTGNAGSAALVPDWAVGGNAVDLLIVRPGPCFVPEFLELLLNSDFVQQQVAYRSVGALQGHFNVGALAATKVVCPPLQAQRSVARQIGVALDSFDELYSELGTQRKLLREHRQALITAAVTGQFDVEFGGVR